MNHPCEGVPNCTSGAGCVLAVISIYLRFAMVPVGQPSPWMHGATQGNAGTVTNTTMSVLYTFLNISVVAPSLIT